MKYNKRGIIIFVAFLLMFNAMLGFDRAEKVFAEGTAFSDVKGHWAESTIDWAVEHKIVFGYPDGTFRPNADVLEPEFIAMLLRAYPEIVVSNSTNEQQWYEVYYQLAEEYNWPLLYDLNGSQFNRGSLAQFMAATQGKLLPLNEAIQYLLDHSMSNGKTSATVEGYGMNDKLTRAEAMQFIKNTKGLGLKLVEANEIESDKVITARGISIGDSESSVLHKLGQPVRKDLSEYGFEWYIYNQDLSKYIQVGILEGKVVGLYTNSDVWSTNKGIRLNSTLTEVKKAYGLDLKYIDKGNTHFMLNTSSEEAPLYLVDDQYIRIFVDYYNQDKVTSIQAIEKSVEESLHSFYGEASEALRESFEQQVFDLANVVRVRFGHTPFVWDDKIAGTARKHSQDMADHNYFDHINLEGQSPFDRMRSDGLSFLAASENIAAGQSSAIFAHEAWMNSKTGHRDSILGNTKRLGVGVHFGGSYSIYYTQNFYTPSRE